MLTSTVFAIGAAALLGQAQVVVGQADVNAVFKAAVATENWATADITNDPFYDTPSNFSTETSKPGDLLRWQDLTFQQLATNFTRIPRGMSLSRFIYVTEDKDRKPIPSSGYVLLPYSLPQGQDKFRTIAWAHGTAGNARKCAPSNNLQLDYAWQAPFLYASQGFAVIATDYAGLGVGIPTTFQYEAGDLHAADVAFSVVAARKVLGAHLTDEWVVAGHSEGGMTAWRTNERLARDGQEELLKAGKFLGAASIAPALQPIQLIPKEIQRAGPNGTLGVNSVYLLQSLEGIYPSIKLADYVSDAVLSMMPLINQSCLITGAALIGTLKAPQVYKNTSWITGPEMQDWQKRINGAGPHKLAGPMIVVQGDIDPLTYPENNEADFDATCQAFPDSSMEWLSVPQAAHETALEAGNDRYVPWIKALFDGNVPAQGCRKSVLANFTNSFRRD
ncbi:hypothetical protein PspLS_06916 [Pyricularia sp. CBS 133598]|nr:hypothetical protein PspLS_06916 [Pyricularia sp. CBS 133598]